jgi:hypothetical protein
MYLVHTTGKGRIFDDTITGFAHIPTSADLDYYTDDTRKAEDSLELPRSAYFYAGRACEEFGNVAMAFAPDCQANHTGSATPFDTGGLMHAKRHIKVRLPTTDDTLGRVQYGKASQLPLDKWREVFAHVLAAYFTTVDDYWSGRPKPIDPEGLYEPVNQWRAWTFEVRFCEQQSIHERAAWCADENAMNALRRLQAKEDVTPPGDPPSALQQFLDGPAALEPMGTPTFCTRIERWIRKEVLQ